MKSKIVKKLLIMVLILTISIPMISYAINLPTEKQEELFLSCDKNEVAKGEKVVLNLDLSLIESEKFEFTLTSNTSIDNLSTEQENVEITNSNNSFKIIVDKSEVNVNQIDLYYQVPEEIEIGTKMELTGILKKYEEENEGQEENLTQEVKITITIVEKQEESEKQDDKQNNSQNSMTENNTKNEQNINKTNNEQARIEQNDAVKTTSSQVQTKTISNNLLGNEETNTYNGESNNYLAILEITNLNTTPEFSKTNTTYFIKVENNMTQININAQAEDENATVNIYGNDNLQEGENKVLISVTAENGEVKIYRIYVTRNS